jgi:hypothetical protein
MALSQITWQEVQQLPDDGHRPEAIEGEFPTTQEGVQPDIVFVSLARRGSEVGEIDLEEIFARD